MNVLFVKKRHALIMLLLFCILGIAIHWSFNPSSANATTPKVTFEWLIEPKFKHAMNFVGGLAWATEESRKGNMTTWQLINNKGKVVIKKFPAFFVQEYVYDEKTDTCLASFTATFGPKKQEGYLDRSGKIAIPAKYRFTTYFKEGMASVKAENGKYGVINSRGETVLPFIYANTVVWDSNMFMVESGDKCAFVDASGNHVTNFSFNLPYTSRLPEGLYLGVIGEEKSRFSLSLEGLKSGLLDSKGKWVLPPVYDAIYGTKSELIGVAKDRKVGFVDTQGNVVIDYQYEMWTPHDPVLYRFADGLAAVVLPEQKEGDYAFGVIDTQGKLLFELPGKPYWYYSEGFIAVRRTEDGASGLVDMMGTWYPLPPEVELYDQLKAAVSDGILVVRAKENSRKYEKNKHGYLKVVTHD